MKAKSLFTVAALATGLVTALSSGGLARAGELDNEQSVTNQQIELAKNLPQTLVLRVNKTTNEVEVFHSQDKLPTDDATKANVVKQAFQKADLTAQVQGELNRDSSSSSWYFCFPFFNWFQPTYYYGGYNYGYVPYYSYGWGNYNYSYYGWGGGAWGGVGYYRGGYYGGGYGRGGYYGGGRGGFGGGRGRR